MNNQILEHMDPIVRAIHIVPPGIAFVLICFRSFIMQGYSLKYTIIRRIAISLVTVVELNSESVGIQ